MAWRLPGQSARGPSGLGCASHQQLAGAGRPPLCGVEQKRARRAELTRCASTGAARMTVLTRALPTAHTAPEDKRPSSASATEGCPMLRVDSRLAAGPTDRPPPERRVCHVGEWAQVTPRGEPPGPAGGGSAGPMSVSSPDAEPPESPVASSLCSVARTHGTHMRECACVLRTVPLSGLSPGAQ